MCKSHQVMELYILEASLKKYIENMCSSLISAQNPRSDGPLVHRSHKVSNYAKVYKNKIIRSLMEK